MPSVETLDQDMPESSLSGEDFEQMAVMMFILGEDLEIVDPNSEIILYGEGDTGTIQTSSDISISDSLLTLARPIYPGSFSEEDDPEDVNGLIRLHPANVEKGYWMVDPIDGTGDRRYGQPGTPEKKGYSLLSSFVRNGTVTDSIVIRPAYKQIITYRHGQILVIEDGAARQITSQTRPVSDDDIIYINARNAYDDVNLPPDFWAFAQEKTGVTFKEVRSGGAGDSLSKLVLGELDLVVTRKGDWKAWDTGPFDPMIKQLGGRLTDCDNKQLGGYDRQDLWHRRGVVASLGKKGGHEALVTAMNLYKVERGMDLVIQPPQK